ncbi:MAG: RluA family pseudouridine synthase [Bacilli bacterium]|nr:RluA family pseudouridine synthase [Bacilli bacterium]
MKTFTVTYIEADLRLDKVLVGFMKDKSRTYVSKLIDDGNVLVNGEVARPSLKVRENDVINVEIPEDKPLEIKSENIPLDVVYEDSDILIINKPQGMVVHPSHGHWEHTLVNAVLAHCKDLSGINGVIRPGIVHRIDKDTSGLICIAKNDEAHNFLAEQLKDHTMNREYVAIVRGVIKENTGTINMPIGRDKQNRQKMAVEPINGKEATTHFTVLERFNNHTLVRCKLVTGRTHQIRVHMAYIGHAVEGDQIYGGRSAGKIYKDGQLLSAIKLTLVHPKTKQIQSFEIDIPEYFKEVMKEL